MPSTKAPMEPKKSRLQRRLLELRDRDSNPNFLIQSQASYH
jgi:hypothetical protein